MSTTPRSKSISAARIAVVLLTLLGLPALSVLGIRFLLPPPRWLLPQDRFSADQAVALGLAVAETFPILCIYQLLLMAYVFLGRRLGPQRPASRLLVAAPLTFLPHLVLLALAFRP